MKQIRTQVFETNSSSTHSISIAKTDKDLVFDVILPNENGNIVLNGGEFGRWWSKHNDAITKANYCAVDAINNTNKLELLFEVLKEQTLANEIIINFSSDYNEPNWSYIDHESVGTSNKAFTDKETLRNFIFNKNSWLFIGHDEAIPEPMFFHVDQYYKDGTVDKIEPKYKLTIKFPGIDEAYYFAEKPEKDKLENHIYEFVGNYKLYVGSDKFIPTDNCWSSSKSEWEIKYDSEITENTFEMVNESLWRRDAYKESQRLNVKDVYNFNRKFLEDNKEKYVKIIGYKLEKI